MTERIREILVSEGEYQMLTRVYERASTAVDTETLHAFAVFLHRAAWELFGRDVADRDWIGI